MIPELLFAVGDIEVLAESPKATLCAASVRAARLGDKSSYVEFSRILFSESATRDVVFVVGIDDINSAKKLAPYYRHNQLDFIEYLRSESLHDKMNDMIPPLMPSSIDFISELKVTAEFIESRGKSKEYHCGVSFTDSRGNFVRAGIDPADVGCTPDGYTLDDFEHAFFTSIGVSWEGADIS